MRFHQKVLGQAWGIISLLFTPLLILIIIVFLTKRDFRKAQCCQCYRIMSHLGFYQVMSGLSLIAQGVGNLVLKNPDLIAGVNFSVNVCALHSMFGIDLLLALNRFTVICSVNIPNFVFKIFHLIAFASFVIICTSMICYPYLDVDTVQTIATTTTLFFKYYFAANTLLSLGVYLMIIVYLKFKKIRHRAVSITRSERFLAIQVFIYFIVDALIGSSFYFQTTEMSRSDVYSAFIQFAVVCVSVCLPVVLPLVFNRTLRKTFISAIMRRFVGWSCVPSNHCSVITIC